MDFFGRNEEIEALRKALKNKEYPNALIYGRRRVGKSAIIKEFLDRYNLKNIYYQCIKTSNVDNVDFLSTLVAKTFNQNYISFKDFSSIFDYLLEKSKTEEIVLILDEYSYWRDVKKGFDSIIQSSLDKAKNSNLKVILCGSELSIMDSLDDKYSPLFGRFSLKMKVLPFDYYDSSLFIEGLSYLEQAKYYSCFGGLPFILLFLDKEKTFKENIISLYLSNFSFVSSFIESTIKEEISKVEYGNSIIMAIAKGHHKYSDIQVESHISNNVQMDRALETLINLNIIKKETPINDELNKKKTFYMISDNSMDFYYKYVYPNQSYLGVMNPDSFYELIIKKDLEEQFIPKKFEMIGKEFLIRMNKMGKINPPFIKIGKYYYDLPKERKNGEFDIVTYSANGYVSYEVKFRKDKISNKIIEEEKESLKSIPLKDHITLGFISLSGYKEKHRVEENFYTIEDIYKK